MFLFIKSSVSSLTLLPLSLQNLETYDTEELISIQVQHLEKEKKEMSHRLRVIAKRLAMRIAYSSAVPVCEP